MEGNGAAPSTLVEDEFSSLEEGTLSLINKLRQSVALTKQRLVAEEERLNRERAQLNAERTAFERVLREARRFSTNAQTMVRLDVGGKRFEVPRHVLFAEDSGLFRSLLSGDFEVETTEGGYIYIDRDPFMFPHVIRHLCALQEGTAFPLKLSPQEMTLLKQDAAFYSLTLLERRILEIEGSAWLKAPVEQVATYKSAEDLILCLLLWDENRLFIGSADKKIYEVIPHTLAHRTSYLEHADYVTYLVRVDANHFVSCSRDNKCKLWRVPQDIGAPCTVVRELIGHNNFVMAAAASPIVGGAAAGGVSLFTCSQDQFLIQWLLPPELLASTDSSTGGTIHPFRQLKLVEAPKSIVCFRNFVIVGCGSHLVIINVSRWIIERTILAHKGPIRKVTACPYNNVIISGSWDSTVVLLKVDPKQSTDSYLHFVEPNGRITLTGFEHWVSDVVVVGAHIVSTAGKVVFYHDFEGHQLRTLPIPHDEIIRCIDFSVDGKVMFTGGFDRAVKATRVVEDGWNNLCRSCGERLENADANANAAP